FSRLSGTMRRKATASMKPAPSARKYWRKVRSQRRRAVTSAPPKTSASPATVPRTSDSSNADPDTSRSFRWGAAAAEPEQLQVMGADGHAEVGALQGATLDILDSPAPLAHEVMVVSPEGVGQLVAQGTVAELDPADHPEGAKEVDRPIDRRQ